MLVTLLGLVTCISIPTELKNQVWTFYFLASPIVFWLMALASRLRPRTKEPALKLSSLISPGMLPLPHNCIPFLALEWDPSFSKGMHEKRLFRGPGSGFQQLPMLSPSSQWDFQDHLFFPQSMVSTSLRQKEKKSKSDHLVGCIWTWRVTDLLIWISESDLWFCFSFLLPGWPPWTGICVTAPCENIQPPLISLMCIQQICIECLLCVRRCC